MEFIHSELMDSTNEVPFIALQEQLFWLQIKVISSLSIPQVPFLCKSSKYIFLNTSYHSGECFYFLCQNPTGSKGTMIKNIYLSEFLINNMLCLFPLFYWQVLQAYSLKGSTNFVTYIRHICHSPRTYLLPDLWFMCHQPPCLLLSRLTRMEGLMSNLSCRESEIPGN